MVDKDSKPLAIGDKIVFFLFVVKRFIEGTAEGRAGRLIVCRRYDGVCFGVEPCRVLKVAPGRGR